MDSDFGKWVGARGNGRPPRALLERTKPRSCTATTGEERAICRELRDAYERTMKSFPVFEELE